MKADLAATLRRIVDEADEVSEGFVTIPMADWRTLLAILDVALASHEEDQV